MTKGIEMAVESILAGTPVGMDFAVQQKNQHLSHMFGQSCPAYRAA